MKPKFNFKKKTDNKAKSKSSGLEKIGQMMETGPSSKVTKKFGMK